MRPVKKVKSFCRKAFLNKDGFHDRAYIITKVSLRKAYSISIADCEHVINLVSNLDRKEDLENGKFKVQTLISELQEVLTQIEIVTKPQKKAISRKSNIVFKAKTKKSCETWLQNQKYTIDLDYSPTDGLISKWVKELEPMMGIYKHAVGNYRYCVRNLNRIYFPIQPLPVEEIIEENEQINNQNEN